MLGKSDFRLNFLGVTVCDFDASFRFYTQTLGMDVRDTKAGWALFDTTGMTFELFAGGRHDGGKSQTVVPGLHVANLENLVESLREKGVEFLGDSSKGPGTPGIRFVAPEGLQWWLSDTPAYLSAASLARPNIASIYLIAGYDKLDALLTFYQDTMGLKCIEADAHFLHLTQGQGYPDVFILDDPDVGTNRGPVFSRSEAPHYLSFETQSIEQASTWLRSRNLQVIQEVTHHEWGGIDFQVLDPDNNPIQIVQYTR